MSLPLEEEEPEHQPDEEDNRDGCKNEEADRVRHGRYLTRRLSASSIPEGVRTKTP